MNFFDTTITPLAKKNVLACLDSGHLSEGDLVRQFEILLEDKFGMKNAVAVNSGTSAIHLALVLAGVGEGDEVILPAQTFVATAEPIVWLGAKPVFADIGMDGNIDVEDVKRKKTKKTKAVIAVSWGGNPCNLKELQVYCTWKGLILIQDNAHALGATYDEEHLSVWGHLSCYSFQAIKELTTSDGGLLACYFTDDYEHAKRLRWFGIDRENDLVDDTGERQYDLKEVGYKYHMNDYSAALGLGNLHGFKERQERRKWIAEYYYHHLVGVNMAGKKEGCSHWLFDIFVDDRPNFMAFMKSRGIPVSVVHKGIVRKENGKDINTVFGACPDLPVQRYWDEHHACLPIHSSLTDEDVQQVVEGVLAGW